MRVLGREARWILGGRWREGGMWDWCLDRYRVILGLIVTLMQGGANRCVKDVHDQGRALVWTDQCI